MDSKSAECSTSPTLLSTTNPTVSSECSLKTNDYGDHVNACGSEKEYYVDMNCSFQNKGKTESAEVVHCDYVPVKLPDSITTTISNAEKLEENKCADDNTKGAGENNKVYTSMKAAEVLSSCYAEAEVPKKKNASELAQKNFLVNSVKQSKASCKKLVLCIVIGVLLLAIVACFIAVFVEIGILKTSGSASLTQSEEISPKLQEFFEYLKQQNISLHELLDGLKSQLDNNDSGLQELIASLDLHNISLRELLASLGTESQSEVVVQELQKLITSLELHNISFHELLTGLGSQSEEIAKKLQKLITFLESHSEEIAHELQALFFSLEVQNMSLGELHAGLGSPGQFSTHPIAACSTLPPSFSSGYYWVRDSVGYSVRVYCDISFSCGGVTGGWMRVAELDMTNSSHQCPGGFMQRTDSNIRTCARNTLSRGCSSVTYSTPNIHYSKVCGKVIGYQVGKTNAFFSRTSISSFYVDGVSLTHGSTYEHIWTFAAAQSESANSETASSSCKCITASAPESPEFVGMDYFCDTGVRRSPQENTLYASNSLWDGVGCGSPNNCCSFNTPPWFYKRLREPTTDDIEMRVCRDESSTNEDIAIETVEIYIHT